MTKRLLVLAAILAIALPAALSAPASALLKPKDIFKKVTVGPKGDPGGEPSIGVAPDGSIDVSYPSGLGVLFFHSKDNGKSWLATKPVTLNAGDTTVNYDPSGATYQSNLRNIDPTDCGAGCLQIDIWKSFDHGVTWPQKATAAAAPEQPVDNAIYGSAASNMPMLVDRQWIDTYTPPGKGTNDARVYLTYHDFVAGLMWVNASKDGGKTFSQPVSIINDPVALANSACNVVPGQLKVVQSGPHAGRVYVVWLSGDVAENAATGCNETQLATFGQVWSAYSDDEGATWTDQLVYDSGVLSAGDGAGLISIGHDACAIFADMALDSAGNPYVVFALNAADAPHTGGPGDQWDIYLESSFDGGKSWNGKSDGTGAPYKVTSGVGSHIFPAVTAGDPGRVAVAYLGSDALVPQLPYGKAQPGGNPDAKWNVFVARSLDVTTGHPSWTTDQVTPSPIHTGDVCTLGIFCLPVISDRSLLDFIDIVGDPAGMVHIAYADTEHKGTGSASAGIVAVSNQVAGTGLLKPVVTHKPVKRPIHLPHPRKTRVLGEKLAATGVGQAPFAGLLLIVVAAVLLRVRRRNA